MAMIRITEAQAKRLLDARKENPYSRKATKKAVFAEIRREHGLGSAKLRIAIEDPSNPMYCVIRSKHTGEPILNSLPEVPTLATGTSPAAQPEKPAEAPAKKAAAPAKAPAKKAAAKPAAKAPAKKAAAKPAAKAPAKKAAAKTAPAKTYPCEVRPTIAGKRVRLGIAKDAAQEKRMIAKYKRDNGIA